MNEFLKEKLFEEAGDDGAQGSGSLLDNAGGGESNDPGSNPDGDTGWYYAEGIKGEGDAPEYFNSSKYKTLSDQAKAYPELAKKLGAFVGAPDEYEVNIPEGITGIEMDMESEATKEFLNFAKESGVNQEFMDKALAFHMNAMSEALGDLMVNPENEMKSLGENAQSRIKNVADWASANLNQETYDKLLNITDRADGIEVVEALIGMTRNSKVPKEASNNTPGMTPEKLKEMAFKTNEAGQRLVSVDPEYKKKVDAAYADFYGSEPQMTIVR